jgi:uncharacterized protein
MPLRPAAGRANGEPKTPYLAGGGCSVGVRARRQQPAGAGLRCYTVAPLLPAEYVPATLPALAEVDAAARQSGLAVDPSELHGALCGWLAAGGAGSPDWLAHVLADDAIPAVATGSTFDQLREASAGQLEDRSFDFELLLPDADAPLSIRSGALFDWCRGFLGGFGLAAGKSPPLSDEGSEALADIAKLAAATPQDDGDEEDEAALVEIEEFVRVAVLLIHGDCVLAVRHRQQFN